MSQPPAPYDRQYNFTDYQTANPSAPLPGQKVDQELNAVRTALNDTQDRLGEIQADDGLIRTSALNIQVIAENVEPLLTDAPIQAVEQAGAQQVGLVNAAGVAKVAELEAVLTSQNAIDALGAASAAQISADAAASSAFLANGYAGSAQAYANTALQAKNSAIVHAQVAQDAAASIPLIVGPAGPQGIPGVAGQKGDKGDQGEPGVISANAPLSLASGVLSIDGSGYYPSSNPSNFITSANLDGYASESFVTSQGYITSSALTGYIQASNNLSDVSDAPTALSNLGGFSASGGNITGATGVIGSFNATPDSNYGDSYFTVESDGVGGARARVQDGNAYTSVYITGTGITFPDSTYQSSAGFPIGGGMIGNTSNGFVEILGYQTSNIGLQYTGKIAVVDQNGGTFNIFGDGIQFPDGSTMTTAATGGGSFNGGTITTPLLMQDSLGTWSNNYVNVTNDDGTGAPMVEVGVINPSLGYAESYARLYPGAIQLNQATFSSYISADGTLNGFPILTQNVADGLYYPYSSNPNSYVTSSTLSSYLTTSAASATYFTITSAASKANTTNPTFTGTVTMPTPTATSNTTTGATTAFVQTNNNVKAWVNFNGTGTVAIRASKNVSSITDNGAADYTVNFGTAMADANYATITTSNWVVGNNGSWAGGILLHPTVAPTTTAVRLQQTAIADFTYCSVAILR